VENLIRLVLAEQRKMSASIETSAGKIQTSKDLLKIPKPFRLNELESPGQLIAITETVSCLIQAP